METVTLTTLEMRIAALVGKARNDEAIKAGKGDAHGFKGDPVQAHINGVAGEMAFCKWAGVYYVPTINTYMKEADVAGCIEIKTRMRADYDLIVRRNDNLERWFVLVLGHSSPTFSIVGWIRGAKATRPEWKQTYGGREAAWFVPQHELKNPKGLRSILVNGLIGS